MNRLRLGVTRPKYWPEKVVSLDIGTRMRHAQVIGTTGVGKTASVLLPWIYQDIKAGHGVVLLDGKGDDQLLETIHAACKNLGREADFEYFSFFHPGKRIDILQDGSATQVTERIINALDFEQEFYRAAQYAELLGILSKKGSLSLEEILAAIPPKDTYAGLRAKLSKFVSPDTVDLYGPSDAIRFRSALEESKVVVISLDTMTYYDLATATGKVVLQTIQGLLHQVKLARPCFLYLDEFSPFAYPAFAEMLNKARSFKLGIVLSHQSLGDLAKVSDAFLDQVLTNTNIKVIFRANQPDAAETFAKLLGTRRTKATTYARSSWIGSIAGQITGLSEREVEEFHFHPNVLKNLNTGECILYAAVSDGVLRELVSLDYLPMAASCLPRQRSLQQRSAKPPVDVIKELFHD